MMRLLSLIIICTIIFTWSCVCITTGEVVSIGYDNALVITSTLGAKAYQKGVE